MFQQLEALSKLSSSRDQQRHGQSEHQLSDGMALVEQAQAEGFTQPGLLQQAASLLTEAIRRNRSDIRAYLGMAYIFLLLEDHALAQKYVHQALQLQPQNALVRAFQTRIGEDYQRVAQRRQQLRNTPASVHSATGSASDAGQPSRIATGDSDDIDTLYDQTEAGIRQMLRELMLAGIPQPVADTAGIHKLEQALATHRDNHSQIMHQLRQIEAELDTSDLMRLIKPIEAHHQRYSQVIAFSQVLKGLKDRLVTELEQVKEIIEEARSTQDPADIEVLEENLEALLDNADAFAQEIETLQKQNYPLAGLEDLYEQLQERLETYQDALEETHARLKA